MSLFEIDLVILYGIICTSISLSRKSTSELNFFNAEESMKRKESIGKAPVYLIREYCQNLKESCKNITKIISVFARVNTPDILFKNNETLNLNESDIFTNETLSNHLQSPYLFNHTTGLTVESRTSEISDPDDLIFKTLIPPTNTYNAEKRDVMNYLNSSVEDDESTNEDIESQYSPDMRRGFRILPPNVEAFQEEISFDIRLYQISRAQPRSTIVLIQPNNSLKTESDIYDPIFNFSYSYILINISLESNESVVINTIDLESITINQTSGIESQGKLVQLIVRNQTNETTEFLVIEKEEVIGNILIPINRQSLKQSIRAEYRDIPISTGSFCCGPGGSALPVVIQGGCSCIEADMCSSGCRGGLGGLPVVLSNNVNNDGQVRGTCTSDGTTGFCLEPGELAITYCPSLGLQVTVADCPTPSMCCHGGMTITQSSPPPPSPPSSRNIPVSDPHNVMPPKVLPLSPSVTSHNKPVQDPHKFIPSILPHPPPIFSPNIPEPDPKNFLPPNQLNENIQNNPKSITVGTCGRKLLSKNILNSPLSIDQRHIFNVQNGNNQPTNGFSTSPGNNFAPPLTTPPNNMHLFFQPLPPDGSTVPNSLPLSNFQRPVSSQSNFQLQNFQSSNPSLKSANSGFNSAFSNNFQPSLSSNPNNLGNSQFSPMSFSAPSAIFDSHAVITQIPPSPPLSPAAINGRISSFQRIIDNVIVATNEWCWHTAIYVKNMYKCGGSLIRNNWILTSAFCVIGQDPDDIKVRLGEDNITVGLESAVQIALVKNTIVHPKYNPTSGHFENNIALVKLRNGVFLTDTVCLICLPDRPSDVFNNNNCIITGFGSNSSGGPPTKILKAVDVPIVPIDQCNKALGNRVENYKPDKSFLCAGGAGGKDACSGDGGGPLVCEVKGVFFQAGVISWGVGCGLKGIPAVYIDVFKVMDWIMDIIGN